MNLSAFLVLPGKRIMLKGIRLALLAFLERLRPPLGILIALHALLELFHLDMRRLIVNLVRLDISQVLRDHRFVLNAKRGVTHRPLLP